MTKENRSILVGQLMMALDVDAHRLYWQSDEVLLELAEKYLEQQHED